MVEIVEFGGNAAYISLSSCHSTSISLNANGLLYMCLYFLYVNISSFIQIISLFFDVIDTSDARLRGLFVQFAIP